MREIVVWVQEFRDRANLYLQWHDPDTGRRRSKSAGTPDHDQAERKRADLEYELRHGKYQEPSRLTWEAFVEMYADECLNGKRDATRRKGRQVLASFGDIAGVRMLADVTERSVSRYATKLREAGRKPATVAAHLAYLKASLRWAAKQKMIVSAPLIDMPRLPRRLVIRTITGEAWARIVAAAPDDDWRLFLWTAWYTGMRRGELLALSWSAEDASPWIDLDSDPGRIWLPADSVKSGDDQWIPIHPALAEKLKAARRDSGRAFRLRLNRGNVSRTFAAIATTAGVKARLHDIRRTFGTRYAPLVPAQVLQRLMRHSSIATTLKYYASLDGSLDEAIRRIA